MSEIYLQLKKRSLNPQDPPLTWQEMNENFQLIEDEINRRRLEVGGNEPDSLKKNEVWIETNTNNNNYGNN